MVFWSLAPALTAAFRGLQDHGEAERGEGEALEDEPRGRVAAVRIHALGGVSSRFQI